jgi:hypothetical protein
MVSEIKVGAVGLVPPGLPKAQSNPISANSTAHAVPGVSGTAGQLALVPNPGPASGVGVFGNGEIGAGKFQGHVYVNGDHFCTGTMNVTKDIVLAAADCAEEFDIGANGVEPGTDSAASSRALRIPHSAARVQPDHWHLFEFGSGCEFSDVQLFYRSVNLPAPSVDKNSLCYRRKFFRRNASEFHRIPETRLARSLYT